MKHLKAFAVPLTIMAVALLQHTLPATLVYQLASMFSWLRLFPRRAFICLSLNGLADNTTLCSTCSRSA